jgi:hypothetical protein
MNSAICSAIHGRSVLEFSYGGGTRTVEPHCHGMNHSGHEVLRAWQKGGFSGSENRTGWKLFEVGQITGLRETGSTFASSRPGYNPNDKQMNAVHCHV